MLTSGRVENSLQPLPQSGLCFPFPQVRSVTSSATKKQCRNTGTSPRYARQVESRPLRVDIHQDITRSHKAGVRRLHSLLGANGLCLIGPFPATFGALGGTLKRPLGQRPWPLRRQTRISSSHLHSCTRRVHTHEDSMSSSLVVKAWSPRINGGRELVEMVS